MRPTFSVKMVDQVFASDARCSLEQAGFHGIGFSLTDATRNRYAQLFPIPEARNIRSVEMWTYLNSSTGRAFDKLRAYIWDGTTGAQLAVSNEAYDADDITKDTVIKLAFTFPTNSIPAGYIYLGFQRDGSPSYAGFWRVYQWASSLNPMPEGEAYYYNSTTNTWTKVYSGGTGIDMAFVYTWLSTIDIDISEYAKEITVDQGKNDIGGDYKESKCSIRLNNIGNQFYPDNPSGPYYPYFTLGTKIKVAMTYNSVLYDLFKGRIIKIDPPLPTEDRDVFLDLADSFELLRNRAVSLGTVSGQTASQLILAVLAAAGVTEYDVQYDPVALASVTWNEKKALDLLGTIVEVGQHHHFVDAAGVYCFRTNQWNASGIPAMTLDLDDPCVDASSAIVIYDISELYNRARVKYIGGNYTEYSDASSILRFSQRDYSLENDLMPTVGYALSIARYIITMKSQPRNGLTITLQEKWPEMAFLALGDVIRVIHSASNLDQKMRVAGMTRRFTRAGESSVDLRCELWVKPPSMSNNYYDYEYANDDYLVTDAPTNPRKAQSFKLPIAGKCTRVTVKIKIRINPHYLGYCWARCRIHTADINGLPTGTPLYEGLTTALFYDGSGVWEGTIEFSGMNVSMAAGGNGYAWEVEVIPASGIGDAIAYYYIYGAGSNTYADGKPSRYVYPNWFEIANREFAATLRIEV